MFVADLKDSLEIAFIFDGRNKVSIVDIAVWQKLQTVLGSRRHLTLKNALTFLVERFERDCERLIGLYKSVTTSKIWGETMGEGRRNRNQNSRALRRIILLALQCSFTLFFPKVSIWHVNVLCGVELNKSSPLMDYMKKLIITLRTGLSYIGAARNGEVGHFRVTVINGLLSL